jgi:hypothetical protein
MAVDSHQRSTQLKSERLEGLDIVEPLHEHEAFDLARPSAPCPSEIGASLSGSARQPGAGCPRKAALGVVTIPRNGGAGDPNRGFLVGAPTREFSWA